MSIAHFRLARLAFNPSFRNTVGIMNPVNCAPLCILIVDDCRDAAASLALLVNVWGHHAVVACDGEEALRLAEQYKPGVVFLDIDMPRMSGWELARRLR